MSKTKAPPVRIGVGEYTFSVTVPRTSRGGISYEAGTRAELAVARELVTRGAFTPESFRFLRKTLGLRAVDLAELLDVTPETISHWETGATAAPKAVWGVVAAMIGERVDDVPAVDEVLRRAATPRPAPRRAIALRA
jgi:DNA-binding XRE family transcriptional regulator